MSDREKLIDMLCEVEAARAIGTSMERCADHLIANGAVVREKGEWVEGRDYWRGDGEHIREVDCSKCGEFADYATNFCPNCGADMRKGENG